MNLILRRLSIVAALLLLIGGAAYSNYLSKQKTDPPKKPFIPAAVRQVEVLTVKNGPVRANIPLQGRLVAAQKIEIIPEVTGVLMDGTKSFREGVFFEKGAPLLRMDDTEARLTLQSQRAALLNAVTMMLPDLRIDYPASVGKWQTWVDQFDMSKPVASFPEPADQREKFFVSAKNIHSSFYSIKSAENRLSKYTIYAPFSGVVTQSLVNTGATLRAGQRVGELMGNATFELEAIVPLADVPFLKVGQTSPLKSTDLDGNWTGRIVRISDQIDPATQNVKVYLQVSGKGLKEGMYLTGGLPSGNALQGYSLPRRLLDGQDRVVVVKPDSTLSLVQVQTLKMDSEQAIIRGLQDGTLIPDINPAGVQEGAKVNY